MDKADARQRKDSLRMKCPGCSHRHRNEGEYVQYIDL